MKKYIYIMFLFVFSGSIAAAQSSENSASQPNTTSAAPAPAHKKAAAIRAQPLKIGVIGGITTGTYQMSPIRSDDLRISNGKSKGIGYQLGLAVRLSIPEFIQIQPELLYSARDFEYSTFIEGKSQKATMTSKTMQLPLMIGFNIRALRLFGGPVFTLVSAVSDNKKVEGLKAKYDESTTWQFGAGFDIRKFFFDVRYTTPFKNTRNTFHYNGIAYTSTISKNDYWTFNIGFFF